MIFLNFFIPNKLSYESFSQTMISIGFLIKFSLIAKFTKCDTIYSLLSYLQLETAYHIIRYIEYNDKIFSIKYCVSIYQK
jgi:hypothetical protein